MQTIRYAALVAVSVLFVVSGANAADPELEWAFKAESNLYAPPLVADVAPNPGKETIISDSEVRRLRCIGAQGKPIWEYDGGWTKRLTSAAALSTNTGLAKAALVIGNADGTVCCVDAATGKELWRRTVGRIEWGAALWADINGDGRDEVVIPTENVGIVALDAKGNPLWKYRGEADGPRVSVRCPGAAADIDGDGRCEIFAAGQFGPLCVNGDGTLRWETPTGDDFISSVTIADANGNGKPELYACSQNDNAAWCFDARTGAIRWKTAMVGGADVYPSSSLAVADLDDDGSAEIVVADQLGYVYCLDAEGAIRWIFLIEKRTHAAPSVGDVDGDGEIEILVAGGDHYLYCIDAGGALEWRYLTDKRLIYPATITDVDNDGKTEILFCGSDKTLRCLTLGGRYAPDRILWPSRRFDAAQSGSCFGKRGAVAANVTERVPLFLYGGFEQHKTFSKALEYPRKYQPLGWIAETVRGGNWKLDSETKLAGVSSLRVAPKDAPLCLATELIPLDKAMRTLDARIARKGAAAKARLRWTGLRGVLREDVLEKSRSEDAGWVGLKAEGIRPPRDARWLQMVIECSSGETWWDEAVLEGVFERRRALRASTNQAGYDIGAPKRFTARSNFFVKAATFALIDENEASVFEAPLKHEGRIQGAYGHDWGHEYWRGDFSKFDTPGTYRVRIQLDDMTDVSWPFEVGENVLWNKTSRPAYRFFYYQRCGMEIPGFHKACHLDDAASPDGKTQHELWGGWHDAGDYNTYDNIPYVLGLLKAYGADQADWNRQDEDGNGVSDFFDEILWGGDHERRMVAPDGSAYGAITSGYGFWGPPELETDNIPGTGDERRISGAESGNDSSMHAAALAASPSIRPATRGRGSKPRNARSIVASRRNKAVRGRSAPPSISTRPRKNNVMRLSPGSCSREPISMLSSPFGSMIRCLMKTIARNSKRCS